MTIREKSSDEFYANLYSKKSKDKFPRKVLFELTYGCNFNCVHCYNVKENKKELSTSQVKDILNQLESIGCFHVGFTGGEPTVRKDFFEILEHAKKIGFRITILTNGFSIDKKFTDKIDDLGVNLNKIDISFLGAKKQTFESITKIKGSYNRVLGSIKLLRKKNIPVMIKTTLMKQNKKEILDIKKIAEKNKCMFKFSPSVSTMSDGKEDPLQYRVSPEETIKIRERIFGKILKLNPDNINISPGGKRFFKCNAGVNEAVISPYGKLKTCPELNEPAFDILNSSLKHAWEKMKKKVEELNKKDFVCKHCYLAQFCETCPARMMIKGSINKCNEYEKKCAILKAKELGVWEKIKDKIQNDTR